MPPDTAPNGDQDRVTDSAAWTCCGVTYKGGTECPKCLTPKPTTAAAPRWVLDQSGDVWVHWVSDDLYHHGFRTASLTDVVKNYGPAQELVLGRVIREAE